MFDSGIREMYIDIISYDAVSEYYCNKIYPQLNELERNLRKLLFNTYIVNFGSEYYSATIDDKLQNKIKGVVNTDNKANKNKLKAVYKANSNEELKEIARLQNFFYSFEYTDIQAMLFTPGWSRLDENKKNKFLESHEDLSVLDDQELRKAFLEFSPKSDWERFFSEKIQISNIEELIDHIRIYRNTIAHFKFFNGLDYEECKRQIRLLNKSIKDAILLTEEKDFMEKNAEILKSSFGEIFAGFTAFSKLMNEKMQKAVHEVMSPALKAFVKHTESWSQIGKMTMDVLNKQQRIIQVARPTFKIPEGIKLMSEASGLLRTANIKITTMQDLLRTSENCEQVDKNNSAHSEDDEDGEE